LILSPVAVAAVHSFFSTSADWESITGMRFSEYQIVFGRDKNFSSIGMELFFLDGFPCYGQAESTRVWISPSRNFAWDESRGAVIRVICLSVPEKFNFAYRETKSETVQNRTTGLLACDVEKQEGRKIMIRFENCVKGSDWKDYGGR